ncbi:glycoside hydrolase family 6 protein [Microbispora sp. NEAU-D428]|uniref:glycoside hydrolase family 6 protein n=1 Tax=Microbispora sitophila TaxID=2771537 RepID=UPI0018671A46|nr:glycoside hydrolase family 6 protein [Microbispora sitophila]MBE3012382.1 glycoside hydrolase family 6 protein [Microbispora sitophila]
MPFGHHRFVRRILTAAAAVVPAAAAAAAGPVLGTTSADAAVTCQVTYASTQWGTGSGGFTAGITVRNTGETLSGWKLTFTFPGSQKLTQGWSARWTQLADHVMAENEPWNGTVASGGSLQLGFNGTWTGSNPPPTDFAFNGVPCQVTVPGTSPSPSASPSASPSPGPLRIVIEPRTVTVPEGGTASVQVWLNRRPEGTVRVGTANVSGDKDLTVVTSPSFTPDNWNVPQSLTVAAAEDDDAVNGSATFDTRSSQATAPSAVLWTATEQDNDTAGPSPSPSPSGDVPVDNPFIGAKGYVDPDWAADVESSAAKVDDATAQKMRGLKKTPTAVWLDRIADVSGGAGAARTLKDHLDSAVEQGAGYITLVLHDLPDRDCRSLVSTAELHEQENGLNRYKAEFVDPVAALLARPEYRNLRVAAVVEPRALTDLIVGGVDTYPCNQAAQSGVYVMGIRYALDKLSPLPNVYTYLDAGSAGWAGWETNLTALATSITETVRGTTAGLNSLDGIATNVADYVPLEEPFLTDPEQTVAGQPIKQSRFVDWNPYLNERDYAVAMRSALIAKGFSSLLGVVVDTSRDGWGGPARPTAVSTSLDVNTYVDQSRVDRRPSRSAMCNQKGAGLGARPVAAPVPGVDAYLWIKRPGESDGAGGPILPEGSDRLLDRMCDPNGSLTPWSNGFRPTGALPDAPLAGDWHHAQFVMLVNNAYPAL